MDLGKVGNVLPLVLPHRTLSQGAHTPAHVLGWTTSFFKLGFAYDVRRHLANSAAFGSTPKFLGSKGLVMLLLKGIIYGEETSQE